MEKFFCVTIKYWRNSESRRQDFPGNLETFHCNPKDFQREGVVGVVLLREEKAFTDEIKKIYKSHQIVLL